MSPIRNACANRFPRPRKRLGQNFLTDETLLKRLSCFAGEGGAQPLLEIGSGIGNFSIHLAPYATRLICVEKDRSLEGALRRSLADVPAVEIVMDDVLNLDLEKRARGEKFNVVGNLPFYATSAIITQLIACRQYIDWIHITVQKEVAWRLVAAPGTKDYGRLTCLVQVYTRPEIREIIPRQAFFPPPEVDAAFVSLRMLPEPSVRIVSEPLFFKVVKAIFTHRRKNLLNGLMAGEWNLTRDELVRIITASGLSPTVRGEQLDLSSLAALADTLLDALARKSSCLPTVR